MPNITNRSFLASIQSSSYLIVVFILPFPIKSTMIFSFLAIYFFIQLSSTDKVNHLLLLDCAKNLLFLSALDFVARFKSIYLVVSLMFCLAEPNSWIRFGQFFKTFTKYVGLVCRTVRKNSG